MIESNAVIAEVLEGENGVKIIKFEDGSIAFVKVQLELSDEDAADFFGGSAEPEKPAKKGKEEPKGKSGKGKKEEPEEEEEEEEENEEENEDELTADDLMQMDEEELADLIEEQELDVDPEEFEDDVEGLRQAIADELEIELPKKGKKGKKK